MNCCECRWWEPYEKAGIRPECWDGACKLNPPVLVTIPDVAGAVVNPLNGNREEGIIKDREIMWVQPVVNGQDFCGQFSWKYSDR